MKKHIVHVSVIVEAESPDEAKQAIEMILSEGFPKHTIHFAIPIDESIPPIEFFQPPIATRGHLSSSIWPSPNDAPPPIMVTEARPVVWQDHPRHKELVSCLCLTCGNRNDHTHPEGLCSTDGHDDWLEYRDVMHRNSFFKGAVKRSGLTEEAFIALFMDNSVKHIDLSPYNDIEIS